MAFPVLGLFCGILDGDPLHDGRRAIDFKGVRAKGHLGFLVLALGRSCAVCKIGRLGKRRHESPDVMN